jgi:hypothetical protein
MKVGALRRIGSYLLDVIPIIGVLSLLFTFFVGELLEPEGYDELMVEYSNITTDYNAEILPFYEQYETGELTQDEYQEKISGYTDQYYLDTDEHVKSLILYFQNALIYYITAFTVLYYAYSVITKGHTLGRKIMRIELQGNINWWTLLVREVIWKTGYYTITLLIGGIIIDILMINFSSNKLAPRDYVTKITVKYEGADYPF